MAREPQTGSLHLPKDVGIPTSAVQAIANNWNTIDGVNARLKQQGIHENVEPDVQYVPVTTALLVTTDVKEYTTLFSAQLRWYNYVVRLVADARATLLQLTNEMEQIEATKRTYFRSMGEGKKKTEKMSAVEMSDMILQDPHYLELKLQHQTTEQYRIKLDAWCEELDRNLKTVSRQIENRRAEGTGGTREGNMSSAATNGWESRQGRAVRP